VACHGRDLLLMRLLCDAVEHIPTRSTSESVRVSVGVDMHSADSKVTYCLPSCFQNLMLISVSMSVLPRWSV
jgi:hypothetical protein